MNRRQRRLPAKYLSRRKFLATASLAAAGLSSRFASNGANRNENTEPVKKAQVAISLDLEMARNFPRWQDTHWDYEKGNLNDEAKRYAIEAARRVKARGGVIHFFAVGRVFEQENVDWLKELNQAGHPIGNHT